MSNLDVRGKWPPTKLDVRFKWPLCEYGQWHGTRNIPPFWSRLKNGNNCWMVPMKCESLWMICDDCDPIPFL